MSADADVIIDHLVGSLSAANLALADVLVQAAEQERPTPAVAARQAA